MASKSAARPSLVLMVSTVFGRPCTLAQRNSRKNEQRWFVQYVVAHVRLHATTHVAGILHNTSSDFDSGTLPRIPIVAPFESEVVRCLKAISVAPPTAHLNFLWCQPCALAADASHTLDHKALAHLCNYIPQCFALLHANPQALASDVC